MKIESWAVTDVGKKRDHNEDSILANDQISLYVVADGMGGHKAGATASRTVIEVIESTVSSKLEQLEQGGDDSSKGGTMMMFVSDEPVVAMLTEAVQAASAAILDKVEEDKSLGGMGTTTVGLFFHENKAYYAHVGDSRLYRMNGDEFSQVTVDHSLVQEQLDAGLISEEDARSSSYKNIITRSVGFERDISVDCEQIPCSAGDLFLLCSDGLTGFVTDEEINEIATQKEPDVALQFFVNLANSRGGDDNISVILVKVSGEDAS